MVGAAAVILDSATTSPWAGVASCSPGLLGLGLGGILIFHRSPWFGVLAHGFFDATSFALFRVIDALGALQQLLPQVTRVRSKRRIVPGRLPIFTARCAAESGRDAGSDSRVEGPIHAGSSTQIQDPPGHGHRREPGLFEEA